jgi:SPP1 family predicted phage head-tail adaptor
VTAPLRARHARVTLQSPARVADEIGGAAIVWADQGEVWATIHATGAAQLDLFDTRGAVQTFRVTINRRDQVRAGWRVLWGARVLRVVSVSDGGAPRIVLVCEEEDL